MESHPHVQSISRYLLHLQRSLRNRRNSRTAVKYTEFARDDKPIAQEAALALTRVVQAQLFPLPMLRWQSLFGGRLR
jgi:hypothetical protein